MDESKRSLDIKSQESVNTEVLKNNILSKWSESDEELLKEWADHAVCYRWLHENAHKKYNDIYTKLNIPIIMISTITGTANFAQGKIVDETTRDYVAMIIGFFSISAGILATVLSFFKISEKKEQHNSCAKLWDKLHRNIQVEMVKPPSERMAKKTMMDITKKEYDRLVDDSPIIPDDIIKLFNTTFKNDEILAHISKPNILNVFQPIKINHLEEVVIVEKNSEFENVRIIETRFREINGRSPTEVELQNIIETNSYITRSNL
jgi:hypothetical protein